MKNGLRLWCALLLVFAGCNGGSHEADVAVAETIGDTEMMRDASSAANEIIRNAADCQAVTADYSRVMTKLGEVERGLSTPTARTSLESLRKQVRTIGEACGAR